MIEITNDSLHITFADIHPDARLSIDLQRTLRIPDDDSTYPLPPGLGRFPLRHVDDFANRLPARWKERGGVMVPMYQAEALWLNFGSTNVDQRARYPFLIRVAAGKINAVTGDPWADHTTVTGKPDEQDYMVVPGQPWLDGFAVEKGIIRQFVAMPLGSGYSAEEQLTGEAEWGGIQIQVHPMRRSVFERRFPQREPQTLARRFRSSTPMMWMAADAPVAASAEMGLAPGGRMTQKIHQDPFDPSDWDLDTRARCFVHLTNSMVWRSITGQEPPTTPPTAAEYDQHGLPWFAHYSDQPALEGSAVLDKLKSVASLGKHKGDTPIPENQSVEAQTIVSCDTGRPVREW